MKKLMLAATAMALTLAFPAFAQSNLMPGAKNITPEDQNFVAKAAQGGLAEVQLGRLAEQRAASPQVKAFAQRMVSDHAKADQDLTRIAQSQGLTVPTELDSKDQATEQQLSGLNGKAFDTAYMRDMLQDHRRDIADFQKEAQVGEDPTVKNFAQKYLPVLRQHLQMAHRGRQS